MALNVHNEIEESWLDFLASASAARLLPPVMTDAMRRAYLAGMAHGIELSRDALADERPPLERVANVVWAMRKNERR